MEKTIGQFTVFAPSDFKFENCAMDRKLLLELVEALIKDQGPPLSMKPNDILIKARDHLGI